MPTAYVMGPRSAHLRRRQATSGGWKITPPQLNEDVYYVARYLDYLGLTRILFGAALFTTELDFFRPPALAMLPKVCDTMLIHFISIESNVDLAFNDHF